nr:type IV pili twitching motility protein PilT [Candidatus Paceibacterota bacterium]
MKDYSKEIEELVVAVTKEGASDLHLTVGRHPSIRVSGALIPIIKKPILTPEDTLGIAMEILNDENKQILLEQREVDFSYSPAANVRFRGNAFFQRGMVGVALRLIPMKVPTIKELNLPEQLADFVHKKQGFFLVVGPVGQGKSTTLAS